MTRRHQGGAVVRVVLVAACLATPSRLFQGTATAQAGASGITEVLGYSRLVTAAEVNNQPGHPGVVDRKENPINTLWDTRYDESFTVRADQNGATTTGDAGVHGTIAVNGDELQADASISSAGEFIQGQCMSCFGTQHTDEETVLVSFRISRRSTFVLSGSVSVGGGEGVAHSGVFLSGGGIGFNLNKEFVVQQTFGNAQTMPISASGVLEPGSYQFDLTGGSWTIGSENSNAGDAHLLVRPIGPRPVLILPGVGATYSADVSSDLTWLLQRGVRPSQLQIDPMTRVYDDLIQTLENAGYVENRNLFKVNYDWRLPPGPDDQAIDGSIAGLTAASLADQRYDYAVDYLGEVLRQAAEQWASDNPGAPPLDAVDLITHSTGGLVARTYIQSGAAYGGEYASDKRLPKINNLIMIGVPNQGASKAWNPLHDNWVVDPAFQMVLSKIVNRAYQKVLNHGFVIAGPDYDISLASITAPQCTDLPEVCFINQYVPTARALLATYDFIDFGSGLTNVDGSPTIRNSLLLDLNAGDPNAFASLVTAKPTIIYGTNGADTPTTVVQDVGPTFTLPGFHPIAEFANVVGRNAAPGETFYRDITVPNGGDGTVPLISSAGQFVGDARVVMRPFTKGVNTTADVDHTALPYNPDVQQAILDTLDVPCLATGCTISRGRNSIIGLTAATACAAGCSNFGLDPVEGFLIDAQGRRLGFSAATGPLTEIPGSVWFGNADGMGWIFGPVQEPLMLDLTGLGQDYYVDAAVFSSTGIGSVTDHGLLGLGARRILPIPPAGTNDTVAPVSIASASPPPNPSGWRASAVTVSIAASDESGGSGVKGLTYSATGAEPLGSATVSGALVTIEVAAEGRTTLTFFARDNADNAETPQTMVIDIDRTAPSLAVPPNQTVTQSVAGGAIVTYPSPVVSDTGSGLAASGCAPASGALFPIGSTTVTCVATDVAGNSRNGTFTVTVNATLPELDGRMHGAGHIDLGRQHQHFVFRVSHQNGIETGRLEYWSNDPRSCQSDDDDGAADGDRDDNYRRDHRSPPARFEAMSIDGVDFEDDPAFQPGAGRRAPAIDTVRFAGTGTWNGQAGYTFEAFATDQGEPGRGRDRFTLIVRDERGGVVARVSGTLNGGNIQSTRLAK